MRAWFHRHPRVRKFVVYWLPALLVAYALFGFVGVPLIIRKVIVPRAAQELNGTVRLGGASYNPFTWRLVLRDLAVDDAAGDPVLKFDELVGRFRPLVTLVSSGWHLWELKVRKPVLYGTLRPDGTVNVRTLLKPPSGGRADPPVAPLRAIPRVVVGIVAVQDGELHLADLTPKAPLQPVKIDLAGLSFTVDKIDTHPKHDNIHTLTASTDSGEKLTWKGNVFVDPLSSSGTLTVERLGLTRFDAYLQQLTTASLVSGELTVRASYEFAPTRSPRVASIAVDSVVLEKLVLTQGGAGLIGLPRVELSGIRSDADGRTAHVGSVVVSGGEAFVIRDKKGAINLLQVLRPDALGGVGVAPAGARPARPRAVDADGNPISYPLVELEESVLSLLADAQKPWEVSLGKLSVSGFTLHARDDAARLPVAATVSEVKLVAGPVKSVEQLKTTVDLRGSIWNRGVQGDGPDAASTGTFVLSGPIEPLQTSAELQVDAEGIDLRLLAGYLPARVADQLPAGDVARGVLTAKGVAELASATVGVGSTIKLSWRGETTVADLLIGSADRPVLSAKTLSASGATSAAIGSMTTLTHEGAAGGGGLQATLLLNSTTSKVGADVIALEGSATLRDTGQAAARGSLRVRGGAISSADLVGPVEAGTDLVAAGDASIEGDSIRASGTLELTDTHAKAAELFGPVDLTMRGLMLKAKGAVQAGRPVASGDLKLIGVSASAPKAGGAKVEFVDLDVRAVAFDSVGENVQAEALVLNGLEAEGLLAFLPPIEGAAPPASAPPTLTAADLRRIKPLLAKLTGFRAALGSATVNGGRLSVTDPTTTPPTVVTLGDLSVLVRGVSTDARSPMSLTAETQVNTSGRAKVVGTLDLTGADATGDVLVTLTALPTPPYSSISGRFTGYVNPEGRLTVSMPVRVENHTVSGTLTANLDRFFLTESTNSPEAISLPVKLGLALLRDSKDQIDVKLPFSGRLDDPSFSFGGLIWQVIANLLTKAATSPFQLLSAAFGGGDGDLSTITFAPGSSELSPEMLSRLDKLGRALADRPALNLTVYGGALPEVDGAVLKRNVLLAQLSGKDAQPLAEQELAKRAARAFESAGLKVDGQPVPSEDDMLRQLADRIELPTSALSDLRAARAAAVMELLAKEKQIDAKRLAIGAGGDAKPPESQGVDGEGAYSPSAAVPGVTLELK